MPMHPKPSADTSKPSLPKIRFCMTIPLVNRAFRAGETVEDYCRACKTDRLHTVIVVDGTGRPIRVSCDYCESQNNFRGGPRLGSPTLPATGRPAAFAKAPVAREGRPV